MSPAAAPRVANRSRYAILGALALRPMSGYDLRGFFTRNLAFFWRESYGQIYPMLRSLVADGAVEPVPDGAGGRRKPYRITTRGRTELATWLATPVAPEIGRVEILLKLFFARHGDPRDMAAHLAVFETEHRARLAQYAAVEARLAGELASMPDVEHWRAAVSYGRHVSAALLAWSAETRLRLLGAAPTEETSPSTVGARD